MELSLVMLLVIILAVLAVGILAGVYISRRREQSSQIADYAAMIHHLSDAATVLSDGHVVAVNPALEALVERQRDDLIGWDTYELMESMGVALPPRDQVRGDLARLGSVSLEIPITLRDGTPGFGELNVSAIDGSGEYDYVVFLRNITARVNNERKLRQRDLQYRKAMQVIGLAAWVLDVRSRTQDWSEDMKALFDIDAQATEPVEVSEHGSPTFRMVHPEDAYVSEIIEKHLRAGEDPPPTSFRIVRIDGEIRHLEAHVGRLVNEEDELTHVFMMFKDITGEIDRQQQLRHAQKMEAVGQLTGGLAHDFNNLLHVILGNAELMSAPPGQLDRSCLEAITRAASRGSELTQRLLAFSRKQMLEFKAVDANESIAQMLPLLQRTLGANVMIETRLDEQLLKCYTDVSQFENCLLNLALNAQHAMPGGGKLAIETNAVELDDAYAARHSEVVPGPYIQITVSDTGIGMSAPVLDRVFEPFFTTKEAGKGSGLGLSMVFGFMKQCRGHISIYSEEGQGTTIKLFFPVSSRSTDEDTRSHERLEYRFSGKMLLVEDDEQVSELTSRLLGSLGFEVVHASDASSAHRCMQAHDDFRLLLTDVMLPGAVNGPEIAETFRKRFRGVPVIFMSGYTENAILNQGGIGEDVVLLNKPFRRYDLVEKIAGALGPGVEA